jgi:hypothetical protein
VIDLTNLAAYARRQLTDEGHAVRSTHAARDALWLARSFFGKAFIEAAFGGDEDLIARCTCAGIYMLEQAHEFRVHAREYRESAARRERRKAAA